MPIGPVKNAMYGLALPVLGKRCQWKSADDAALGNILRRHRAVGACIQRFENGKLTDVHAAGFARLEGERVPAAPETIFRTASVAKMVTALLVFRLQTLGRLNVQQEVSELIGFPVRNPSHPDAPLTLAMLLSHTSSIVDSPAYYDAFSSHTPLQSLLSNACSYRGTVPGAAFCYSNLAAGMIGCILEKQLGESLETIAQRELFAPLGVRATFDITTLRGKPVANSYRVLPDALAFDAQKRIASAQPLDKPNPQQHYLLSSGSLYLTARDLAVLTLAACNGAQGFVDARSLSQMQKPLLRWPEPQISMRHGMGMLEIDDASVYPKPLRGHQGFAYGAVNGVFFDADGNGFASLNSGASERRLGHLALINRDLIQWAMKRGDA